MADESKTYRVFVSAAEHSADAHCAGLIRALNKSRYKFEFVGVGGAKMAEAGCELLDTTVAESAMGYKAFAHIIRFYKLIRRISRYFKTSQVDLVVVCDSPAFNFHIAKIAKANGIKTLFYVAPQLWAWGAWRIEKLRRFCDKLCCILPFEESWFSQRGIDASFVGNPLLDELDSDLSHYKKGYTSFEPKSAKIALMPGSRTAEIESLWVAMQQITVRLKRKYPGISITTVAVDEQLKEVLKSMQIIGFRSDYVFGTVAQTASAADFSIVASGSATLQVAAVGCPMVIMYQSSKILWHLLGRWLLKTKYLSLVNILAQRELVPEFMPYFSSVDPITESAEQFFEDSNKLAQVSGELIELTETLRKPNTAQKVGKVVVELLKQKPPANVNLSNESAKRKPPCDAGG